MASWCFPAWGKSPEWRWACAYLGVSQWWPYSPGFTWPAPWLAWLSSSHMPWRQQRSCLVHWPSSCVQQVWVPSLWPGFWHPQHFQRMCVAPHIAFSMLRGPLDLCAQPCGRAKHHCRWLWQAMVGPTWFVPLSDSGSAEVLRRNWDKRSWQESKWSNDGLQMNGSPLTMRFFGILNSGSERLWST